MSWPPSRDRWSPRFSDQTPITHRLIGGRIMVALFQSPPLGQDRAQHPDTIRDRLQVAYAVQARLLHAGHLDDREVGMSGAKGQERLDFESVAPLHLASSIGGRLYRGQFEHRQDTHQESVVAVAQVRVTSTEEPVDQAVKSGVAEPAKAGDVMTLAALDKLAAFSEIGAGCQGSHEGRDLTGIG